MPICDRCLLNEEDCHEGFPAMRLTQKILAWKERVTDDLAVIPEWADGCPGFDPIPTKPFATADEVRAHRDEEEDLVDLIIKAEDDGRLEKNR